jgi:peroxiredoxin Q/BCP
MPNRTKLFLVTATVWVSCVLAGCGDPPFKSPANQEEAASKHSQAVNNPAPDFTLLDQNGKPVSLGGLKGEWVVLYFYPQDDTPGCTCEATEFTSALAGFGRMNAKIYGISGDTPGSHQQFIKAYKLGLDLLSDPDHKVMRQYGAWVDASLGDKTYGRVIRSTMIIDPNGVIRYHWPEVVPDGHADRVRQKLAQLQAESK